MDATRDRDSYDAMASIAALALDAAAIWVAQMIAVFIRYSSGWMHLNPEIAASMADVGFRAHLYAQYAVAAAAVLPLYALVFQILKLYTRPQEGTFTGRVPRIVRACLLGGGGVLICTGLLNNTVPFISNGAVVVSLFTVSILVLAERAIAFRLEIALARRMPPCHRAIILGVGEDALRFIEAVREEPRMRTDVVAVLAVKGETIPDTLPSGIERGAAAALEEVAARLRADMLVLASHALTHDETVDLVVWCERHLVRFTMIPDLFRMMTHRMDFGMVGNVPLVGVGRWPLDQVWNRIAKRLLDIAGAIVGLAFSAPIVAVAAVFIKAGSPGPVFYRQPRCGQRGKTFSIYKLRTMRQDGPEGYKPGWTTQDDPRRTKVGAFLRKWNIDELPQFFNVLRGDMSLVGPRPEQPCFVEQFTSGIEHYMWRHVSKPGITGWAQVNGLRGDTSISERVKYDLYYLENWSLAFDFKILARTFFSYRNAG